MSAAQQSAEVAGRAGAMQTIATGRRVVLSWPQVNAQAVGQHEGMLEPDLEKSIAAARAVQGTFVLAKPEFSAASVGAALRTATGAIHTGVCIDLACGIGFCAEHAAIAEMLKHREVEISAIVAVNDSEIISPCGRCRESMAQLTPRNSSTRVVLPNGRVVPLCELLPEHWLFP